MCGLNVDKVIDTQAALERIGGLKELYYKLLKQFLSTHIKAAEKIMAHLEAGDFQLAYRVVHTVKSLAGQIGATALFNVSAHLERAIDYQTKDMDQYMKRFREEFDVAIKAMEVLLETGVEFSREIKH